VAKSSGLVAQRSMMEGFSARGLANPPKTVTQKGFREHLVMGLVEDDLPYSLGEKQGMRKLFAYLVPRGITVPSHQTVRRDINLLHADLNAKLNERLQVSLLVHASASRSHRCLYLQKNTSKIAIASDLWTSKNSVYAFAGVVAYWIDRDWELNECVLELLPLSGDHSGKASGKLIHKALQERGIATKLSTSNCIRGYFRTLTSWLKQVPMVPIMHPVMAHSIKL
jgi:hypothetical protein